MAMGSSSIGIVKVHDDYLELNDKKYSSIDSLADDAAKYSELHVNAHPCVNTSIIIELMEKIRKKRKGSIHLGCFGSSDDGTCH